MVSLAFPDQQGPKANVSDQRLLHKQYEAKYEERLELHASQQNSAGQTVQVSASVSNTVSISGYTTRSHTFVPDGVQKYEAIQDKPKTSAAADNILNFISAQLATDFADGASLEDIESRLAAGLQGFMQGYSEAADILKGSGLLSPEIEEAIQQTYDGVLAGINQLAEKYGVASPIPEGEIPEADELAAAPVTQYMSSNNSQVETGKTFADIINDVNKPMEDLEALLQSTKMDYEGFESKAFSFELKTQDGDVVTITASSQRSSNVGAYSVDYTNQYANMNARGYQMENSVSNAFNFSVKGEIDEGELKAIDDLLGKIGQLSETFFSGNISEAFDMALELGFDGEEIAQFSLNLKHETYQKLDNSYGSVQQLSPSEEPQGVDRATMHLKHLAGFIQMLEEARLDAQNMGLDKDFIGKAAGYIGQQNHAEDDRAEKLQGFMGSLLNHLNNPATA